MTRRADRPRGGRPPADPAERRQPLTLIWATPWERYLLAEAAEAACLPLSRYLLLAGLGRKIPPPVSRLDLAAQGELAALASHLHQALQSLRLGLSGEGLLPLLTSLDEHLQDLRRRLAAGHDSREPA